MISFSAHHLLPLPIGTHPNAVLVNRMLDLTTSSLREGEHPVIHSDRDCHYCWPGWIERMDFAELERFMSKKGCSSDTAACEGLFGRLKNQMFYNRDWTGGDSIHELIDILNEYLLQLKHLHKDKNILGRFN